MTEEKTIRVLQLFTIMNRGGAETMIMNYYRHIDRTKVQFDFAVHRQERGAYEDEIEALGGKIYRFLPFHPKNFRAYRKQISRFFDEHPEYRIVHGHVMHLGYFFYREARQRNIPCIILHSHNNGMNIDLKAPFHLLFKKISLKSATHFFACGDAAARWMFGKKTDKEVVTIKNAIETEKYIFDHQKSDFMKQQLGLNGKFIVGHIGRFSRQKNHSFVVDVFNELHKHNPDSALVLVGNGELMDSIRKKVKYLNLDSAVHFLGLRNDVPALLQAFDTFIFPSHYEGLGIVVIEAQASGLKCIVSENVPKEVEIVNNFVEFISLKKASSYWAKEILKYANRYNRKDTSIEVRNAGYDVLENAKCLERFYLLNYHV